MLEQVVITPASDAFLEVGTLVAVMLAGFGLLQWRSGGAATRWLERHRRLGPLAGALLGIVPGCGGAIVVMPLYLRGTVSFGTIAATLTATMGDSAFVLLAAEPTTFLLVHAVLLVVGVATGIVVDAVGVAPRSGRSTVSPRRETASSASPAPGPPRSRALAGARSTVGAAAAPISLFGRPVARDLPRSLLVFWALIAAGAVVAVPSLLELVPAATFDLGAVPTTTVLGALGATLCVVAAISDRRSHAAAPSAGADGQQRPREVLTDAARETARVTAWVVVAFVGYEALVVTTGLDVGALPVAGLVGVLAGALLGLVPGCGPQLVLTGLYAQGVVPLPALAANALSQDGDALLPLLAADRRSALTASAVTLVPGLLVGAALVGLGW